ncbi:MAG TPA: Gfo/Idh/MocA family oxidoreductase [Bacillota bacterium]|nr:Gfo/Idh/MocA family oxidoreductase [Bacillota bacterium]
MNVAIIGCGLIGRKRAAALGGHRLVAAVDVCQEKAAALAENHPGAVSGRHWREAAIRPDVDIVIVATTNNWLAPITLAAVEAGKHVLVEKPAARNAGELEAVMEASVRQQALVKVGFNLRFHPALRKAREIVDSGVLGPLMFVRGRYGHGGRPGYDREWRADPGIAGGGELLDQGIHLIDLSRWFLGEFVQAEGFINTYYWNMPVEDNAFLLLKTDAGQAAWLHVSCTEWKNLFSFEIYGKRGKLHVEGLGGSYGTERLVFYKMLPCMGLPETVAWEYYRSGSSWQEEFDEFARAIQEGRQPDGNLYDAKAALDIIGKIYGESEK